MVVFGALALTTTAYAKPPCPMGEMDGSSQGATAAGGPSGSDRAGTMAPLAPAGAAPVVSNPAGAGNPSGRAEAQPAAATVSTGASAGAYVPATTTVSLPQTSQVAVPAAPTAAAQAAERAARRAAATQAAARRAAVRRERAASRETVAMQARMAGHERRQAPARGSSFVASAVTGSHDGIPSHVLLIALLGAAGLGVIALAVRRRGSGGAPVASGGLPDDPSSAAHAAMVEAELQEIIAEERAARQLDPLAGGRR